MNATDSWRTRMRERRFSEAQRRHDRHAYDEWTVANMRAFVYLRVMLKKQAEMKPT